MKVYEDVLVDGQELVSDGAVAREKWFGPDPRDDASEEDLSTSKEKEATYGKHVVKAIATKFWYCQEAAENLSEQQYQDKEDKSTVVQKFDLIDNFDMKPVPLKKFSQWQKIQLKYFKTIKKSLPKGPAKKAFVKAFQHYFGPTQNDDKTYEEGHTGFGEFVRQKIASKDIEFYCKNPADALAGSEMLVACTYQEEAPYAPQMFYFLPGLKAKKV
jgi:hypothetical protein